MTAKIINGLEIAKQIQQELLEETAFLKQRHHITPGLVTILVGTNPASISYVTAKQKASHELGFHSVLEKLPEETPEHELLNLITRYNNASDIHGILVQLPLPEHIDENRVIHAISPDKDVDGFHPVNIGKLMIGGKNVRFNPCTPSGIQQLLLRSGIETKGAEVVIVGRSNIVGKPLANMLLQKSTGANATVTIVHTATRNIESHCRRADILIVAAGVPGLVKSEWIKPLSCVIDVGVNRVGEKTSQKTGKKIPILKGDVAFESAKEIAGFITPVPGGVGPMTITMLMANTLKSAKLSAGIPY